MSPGSTLMGSLGVVVLSLLLCGMKDAEDVLPKSTWDSGGQAEYELVLLVSAAEC